MNFRTTFIENEIELSDEFIRCIEIENKEYFYRLISILNEYASQNELSEELIIYNNNFKIKIFIDYFNLDLNNKKT